MKSTDLWRDNGRHALTLERAVARQMWATPMPSDVDGGRTTKGKHRQSETGLRRQVMWRSPQARDGEGNNGSLNPTWVEWLMGFPLEWTALEPSAMQSFRKSRKSSGGRS
jgi:hypothetical protein